MLRSANSCLCALSVAVLLAARPAFAETPSTFATPFSDANGTIYVSAMNSGPVAPQSTQDSIVTVTPSSAVQLSGVPTSTWTYGCSATAAGMIFGYYDRHGYANIYTGPANGGIAPVSNLGQGIYTPIAGATSLIATQMGFDGRTTYGHVDDYWISTNSTGPDPFQTASRTEHAWSSCTADYMGTNQWKWDFLNNDGVKDFNVDGGTALFSYGSASGAKLYDKIPAASAGLPQTELCHGLRLFAESRGYTVVTNYTQSTDNHASGGFSFANFRAEIDAGRPVMLQVVGHSMVGIGYDAASSTVYLHDTWDNAVHSMIWGGSYAGMALQAVTVIQLAAVTPPWEFSKLTGGSWHSTENWLNGTLPTSTSNVVFHLGRSSPYTITATGAATAGSLTVQTDKLALALATHALAITNALTLADTPGQVAQLAHNSGTLTMANAFVGGSASAAGGQGVLIISGGTAVITGSLKLWNSTDSALNFSSGSLSVATLDTNGNPAHFNWTGGALNITGAPGLNLSASGPLGSTLNLSAGKGLNVSGVLTLSAGASLTLSGGHCDAASITNAGALNATTNSTLDQPLLNNGTIGGPTGSAFLTLTAQVSGPGSYTGNTRFAGTFSPGNSPAIVHLDNVELTASSILIMEIGGTAPGTGYDQLIFDNAALDGILHIDLWNSFQPHYGDSFQIFVGSTTSTFDDIELPTLSGNLGWDTSELYTLGTVSIVPEPASLSLFAAAALGLLRRRRR